MEVSRESVEVSRRSVEDSGESVVVFLGFSLFFLVFHRFSCFFITLLGFSLFVIVFHCFLSLFIVSTKIQLLEVIGKFFPTFGGSQLQSVVVCGSMWQSLAVSGSFNFYKLIISIGLSAAGAKADCTKADCALPTILS